MPKAAAVATNVIKINIDTKTKKKKPRKTRARKPAPIAPAKVQLQPIPPPTMFPRNYGNDNLLRDIQTSQMNLSDLTKRNTEEIRRLSTLSTSLLSPPAPVKVEAPRTPKPAKVKTPKPVKLKAPTPKVHKRVKELRDRLSRMGGGKTLFSDDLTSSAGLAQSGTVPAPKNPAFGGAGAENVASYSAIVDQDARDAEIRSRYEGIIDSYDDVSKLKGWANKNLDTNQNRNKKSLAEFQEYLKTDNKFYDVFYARELAQYHSPEKGGADDAALNPL